MKILCDELLKNVKVVSKFLPNSFIKMKRWIIILKLIFVVSLIQPQEIYHFFDKDGKPFEKYEYIYQAVKKIYPESIPEKIIIEYIEGNHSKFNINKAIIYLSTNHLKNPKSTERTIAHELSHICLGRYTNSVNVKEQFRFFDEGFANIVGYRVINDIESYKKQALIIAAIQNKADNMDFKKVQDWEKYYARYKKNNYYAYPVGSSFDFMIIDSYGEEMLFKFFKDIAKTKNLKRTFKNVFKKDIAAIEIEWKEYVSKIKIDDIKPKVVKMFPKNGAKNVDVNLKEIIVEFNTSMRNNICVATPCDEGICYKNAYWKSDKILVIKVDPKLLSDHEYRLSLGSKRGGCRLRSIAGIELEITLWTFKTGR